MRKVYGELAVMSTCPPLTSLRAEAVLRAGSCKNHTVVLSRQKRIRCCVLNRCSHSHHRAESLYSLFQFTTSLSIHRSSRFFLYCHFPPIARALLQTSPIELLSDSDKGTADVSNDLSIQSVVFYTSKHA